MPANAKYIPFLKTFVPGKNIQNDESTKKKSETPKNIFMKNKGLSEVAL